MSVGFSNIQNEYSGLSIWFFKNIIADRERKIMHDLAYM
jgi:hypothetical protein